MNSERSESAPGESSADGQVMLPSADAVIETLADAVSLIGADGTMHYANPALRKLTGQGPEEVIGRSVTEFVHPEDLPGVEAGIRRALEHGDHVEIREYRWRCADGSWRWLQTIGRNRLDDPRVRAFVCSTRDVHERHRLEASLERSEHRFRKVVENIPQVFWTATRDFRETIYVSPAYEKVWGRSVQEVYEDPRAWERHVHPDDREPLRQRLAQAQEEEGSFLLEYRIVRPDGEVRWIRSRGHPVRAPDSDVPHVTGIAEDVTEDKARENRLRELSRSLDQVADAVVLTDPDGWIRYVNESFEATFGLDPEDVLGQPVATLRQRSPEPEALFAESEAALRAGETWRGTVPFRHPDGSLRHLDISAAPVRDEKGELAAIVNVNRDVTRERELEEALTQAQRMEAVGRLSGGIAHHFNNLLTAIDGYAELLERDVEDDQQRADVRRIRAAAERATKLTRQLLAFGRQRKLESEPIDLAALARSLLPRLERRSPEGVTVECEIAPRIPRIRGDRAQLEQVIWNLLANARDAVSDTGRIRIRVDEVELSPGHTCACGARSHGHHVRLQVVDDGCGMDRETLERAFEPFFSTRSDGAVAGEGVGLGLTFVYAAVDAMGGHVCASSRPGVGTTFEILLPPGTSR